MAEITNLDYHQNVINLFFCRPDFSQIHPKQVDMWLKITPSTQGIQVIEGYKNLFPVLVRLICIKKKDVLNSRCSLRIKFNIFKIDFWVVFWAKFSFMRNKLCTSILIQCAQHKL